MTELRLPRHEKSLDALNPYFKKIYAPGPGADRMPAKWKHLFRRLLVYAGRSDWFSATLGSIPEPIRTKALESFLCSGPFDQEMPWGPTPILPQIRPASPVAS